MLEGRGCQGDADRAARFGRGGDCSYGGHALNEFQLAILVGAIIAALISYKLPRALLWMFLGGTVAVACDFYYAYGLPRPAAFTLASDALLCLSIHWFAKERWELRIFNIYQLSVLISLLRLPGVIASPYVYTLLLELLNWAALLFIAGTAILGRVGAGDYLFYRDWRSRVHRAYTYLRSPRETAHWRKAS